MKTKKQIWAEQLKRYTDHETTDLSLVVEDAMRLYVDECLNEILKDIFNIQKEYKQHVPIHNTLNRIIEHIENKSFE